MRKSRHGHRDRLTHTELQLAALSGSSRKSQSVRLEHDTLGSVAASCTYASAINASKISSVFIVYRRKTLTGSPDPTHANGTDKTLHNWWRIQPVGSVHRKENTERS